MLCHSFLPLPARTSLSLLADASLCFLFHPPFLLQIFSSASPTLLLSSSFSFFFSFAWLPLTGSTSACTMDPFAVHTLLFRSHAYTCLDAHFDFSPPRRSRFARACGVDSARCELRSSACLGKWNQEKANLPSPNSHREVCDELQSPFGARAHLRSFSRQLSASRSSPRSSGCRRRAQWREVERQ